MSQSQHVTLDAYSDVRYLEMSCTRHVQGQIHMCCFVGGTCPMYDETYTPVCVCMCVCVYIYSEGERKTFLQTGPLVGHNGATTVALLHKSSVCNLVGQCNLAHRLPNEWTVSCICVWERVSVHTAGWT